MSFWLWGQRKNGRKSLYSATCSFHLVLLGLMVLFALIAPLIQWLKMP